MPLLATTSDRFVTVAATLHISKRLVGSWLASRIGISGTIVSLSNEGHGQFQYRGTTHWWLQLRAPGTLHLGHGPVAVRITGHRAYDDFVIVDFVQKGAIEPPPREMQEHLDEQNQLDLELGAYWSLQQHQPTTAVDGSPVASQCLDGTSLDAGWESDGENDSLAFNSALIDSLTNPVFVTGEDGRYVGANQAFADATGRKLEELVGRRPQEIWDKRSPSGWDGGGRPGTANTEPLEVELIWGDGSCRHLVVLQSPFQTPGAATASGVIGILHDASELQSVRRAQVVSTHCEQHLRESAVQVRSEADVVAILASLLQARDLDPELRDQVDAIGAACNRLLEAVDILSGPPPPLVHRPPATTQTPRGG